MKVSIKKKLASDFIYTFSALLLVNIILQVVIYPLINKFYSAEVLGDIVFFSGIIYTISASVGGAVSNQKLLLRSKYDKTNGDFNLIIAVINIAIFVVLLLIALLLKLDLLSAVLYSISGCLVFLRYFAEVEFRLTKNFKGYLIYYIIVSAGYLLGFGLFLLTGLWYFIFIVGESLAVFYVLWKGSVFKPQQLTGETKSIAKLVAVLMLSYLLGALAAHYYKIFINLYLGGDSVTVYYVSSFFGKSLDLIITPITTLMLSYLTSKDSANAKWSSKKILVGSVLIGVLLYVGFVVATPIYCNILYPNLYQRVFEINFVVNIAQSISAVSSILIVFVLINFGTKKHFIIQLIFVLSYMLCASLMTYFFGLIGFAIGAIIGFSVKFILIAIVMCRGEKKDV